MEVTVRACTGDAFIAHNGVANVLAQNFRLFWSLFFEHAHAHMHMHIYMYTHTRTQARMHVHATSSLNLCSGHLCNTRKTDIATLQLLCCRSWLVSYDWQAAGRFGCVATNATAIALRSSAACYARGLADDPRCVSQKVRGHEPASHLP